MSKVFALSVVFLFGALLSGCFFSGVSEEGNGEIGMIDFGDDPTPEPLSVVSARVGVPPEVLVEINFLYSLQVSWESLRGINRDMQGLLEYGGPGEVGVEWVVQVHDVSHEADRLFRRLTAMGVPASQRAQYEDNYLDLLEAVRITGFGGDRVLAAALRVGPTGRTVVTMPDPEREEFLVLTRESSFYLRDAEKLIERGIERVGEAISGVGLR